MRALYVLLAWLAAAVVVVILRDTFALQVVAIVIAGLAYTGFSARGASVQHGLAVGAVWATLSIVAEMALHFPLLGGPAAHPAFRNLLLLTWIAAPALIARRHAGPASAPHL